MLQQIERQAQTCEERIRKWLNQFYLILDQEKELCLKTLQEEKTEKIRRIQLELMSIDAKLASLSDRIKTESVDPLNAPLIIEPDPPPPAEPVRPKQESQTPSEVLTNKRKKVLKINQVKSEVSTLPTSASNKPVVVPSNASTGNSAFKEHCNGHKN
ncbi:hypothetical protein WMY93_033137 [Mugilogobius chulae]|uniref:Uncharacterized protein n=1 Tax=Mugilogobius chulae TaxID=88201 RepID=A0AAW0MSR5_9GOBI